MADVIITKDYLHGLFEYREGNLYWKNHIQKARNGKKAGHLHSSKYTRIKINYKIYKAHQLIFMMFNGFFPKMIDHIDGNPKNNKIENLRETTAVQNLYNSKIRNDNSSGTKGICWNKKQKKWRVYINVNKKRREIGSFKDLEIAELVAIEARNKYHGEFSRNE
jgi:hypothetical protein